MTKAELLATLQWMVEMNIITIEDYTLLLTKSLPYAKG